MNVNKKFQKVKEINLESFIREEYPKGSSGGEGEWLISSATRDDKNPSLCINLRTGLWTDYTTSEGGDLVDLIARDQDLSLPDAADYILRKSGVPVIDESPDSGLPAHADGPPKGGSYTPYSADNLPSLREYCSSSWYKTNRGAIEEIYSYPPSGEEFSFAVVRFTRGDKKAFGVFHLTSSLAWRSGYPPSMKSGSRPLYDLPAGKDGVSRGFLPDVVYVVEGEKTAHALSDNTGARVVTWPGGSNAWNTVDWSPLKGHHVLLWPDNDPPGIHAMNSLSMALQEAGAQVDGILDVGSFGWPKGYDAYDWFEGNPSGVFPWVNAPVHGDVTKYSSWKELGPSAFKARLSGLTSEEYKDAREVIAHVCGMSVKAVDNKRDSTVEARAALGLEDVPPADDPQDIKALLEDLSTHISRFVVLDARLVPFLAVWLLWTYLVDYVDMAPILAITSGSKRCGKTILLTVLSELAYRASLSGNASAAAIFRFVELCKPCLFVDEYDTWVHNETNQELVGIINTGHSRKSGYVLRCENKGKNIMPAKYSCFGPKVLAGIRALPSTIKDRSIEIRLHRKPGSQEVVPLRFLGSSLERDFMAFRGRLRRCADDILEAFLAADPKVPNLRDDRASDNFYSFVALADIAGGDWPKYIREAMVFIVRGSYEGDTVTLLVRDILAYFETRHDVTEVTSHELCNYLNQIEEAPWSEMRRDNGISPKALSDFLRPLGIHSYGIRTAIGHRRGYKLVSFAGVKMTYADSSGEIGETSSPLEAPKDAHPVSFKKASAQPDPELDPHDLLEKEETDLLWEETRLRHQTGSVADQELAPQRRALKKRFADLEARKASLGKRRARPKGSGPIF